MKGVYFPVPNQEFTTPENIKININNLTCGDVALLSINITTAPLNSLLVGVNVSVPGLTVRCTGRWSYVLLDVPLISGDGGVIALVVCQPLHRMIMNRRRRMAKQTLSSSVLISIPYPPSARPSPVVPPMLRSKIFDEKSGSSTQVVDSTWQGSISANIVEIFKSTVNCSGE